MRSFFKMFFASLLSLIVFTLICVFLFVALVSALTSKEKPDVPSKSVLLIDLGQPFPEQMDKNPIASLAGQGDIPGLYDVIRLLEHAKTDENISGILIKADENLNGFASSNELRNALIDFKKSKKFVI